MEVQVDAVVFLWNGQMVERNLGVIENSIEKVINS